MIAAIGAWWRARTSRERLLLNGLGVFAGLLFVFWSYQAAAGYRADAAASLAGARAVEANVARLAQAAPAAPAPGGDVSLRGLAVVAAEEGGLEVSRVEPAGADRIRIVFAPTDSLRIYRWIETIISRGAYVSRTAIIRANDGDQVIAEFEVAPSP